MTYAALADLVAPGTTCGQTDDAECPRAVVFDVRPHADGANVVARLAAANPDGTPGGTYEQALTRAADIRNYDEMGSLPVALTALLAAGAILAFVATLFAAPRARRRDLAILKTIGLARSQIRKTLLAQALVTVAISADRRDPARHRGRAAHVEPLRARHRRASRPDGADPRHRRHSR